MKKIPLGRSGKFALVDEEDFIYLSYHKWSLSAGYAYNAKLGYMHRLIFKTDKEVDHINNNPIDNRKSNLREVTRSQNTFNRSPSSKSEKSSKYKGVTAVDGVWQAQIRYDGKYKYLGRFKTENEAAIAYNKAAIKYHKEFAWLNFVEGE